MRVRPLITVITICQNVEKTIADTMETVLGQNYKDLEYIIVDGLSSDNTLRVIDEVARKYRGRRVTVISGKDSGIADAMNKGIRHATGEIIAHLHAGDRYLNSDVIDRVVDSYRREGWRWAVASSLVVDERGRVQHIFRPSHDHRVLLRKNFIPHQSTFVVKDIFDRWGMFDETYTQGMDYEFWLRIAFRGGERFTVLPFATTYYLDGGRSSHLLELLRYGLKIRRSLVEYGQPTTACKDGLFLGRIVAFYWYYYGKKILHLVHDGWTR